jgi:predicted dehydrogenase
MMGQEHIMNLNLTDGAQLVAISDPHEPSREEALKIAALKNSDVRAYATHQEMLTAEELGAVIIASPNFTHIDVLRDLLPRDIAILCEKPLCTTIEDAQEITHAVNNREALFWTGLEYRYMPPVQEFVQRLHMGITGKVRMLYVREHRFPFLPKIGDWNRFNKNTGGTLVEKCCHFFDLMRHLLQDEPVRIFASGGQDVNHREERYDGKAPDILDNAYVIIDFAGGTRAVLDLCMFAEGAEEQEEIYAVGDKGRLEVKIPGGNIIWSPRDKSGPFVEHIDTPTEVLAAGQHHGATYYQLQAFQTALLNGTPPQVSAVDGLRSVEMGIAAQQSIATGLPVDLTAAPAWKTAS